MEHLEKFGRFDEISAGYSWGNSQALRYIWDEGEIGSTPVVLILRRTFTAPRDRCPQG